MLFRATIALFVLFITLPDPSYAAGKKTASEVTVVGPTENSAAFIAVRPVAMSPAATPMQPEVPPAQALTAGTLPQPAAEEPETQAEMQPVQAMTTETPPQPSAEEHEQADTMTGRGPEMVEQTGGEPIDGTEGKKAGRMQRPMMERPIMERPMMERLQIMLGEPTLTTADREMLRGVIMRMRGRRLQRRAATQETPRATTRMETTPQQVRAMEPTAMQRTTVERPIMDRPMTTMMAPGARFNTVVGDVELTREMLEGSRTAPETTIRDMEFNTFVGRLRGPRTELGRGQEPQWEQVWMPRGRSVRGWAY